MRERAGAIVRRLTLPAGAALVACASAAHAAEKQVGVPQLDFANPLTISQVVWLAIIFFALYMLLKRWALPQVAEVLQVRAETIRRDLEAAQSSKAAADSAASGAKEAARQAHVTAQAQITAALEAAKQSVAAETAALDERLEADLAAAEQRIAAARADAMSALQAVAAETTSTVVTRLTGRAVPSERLNAAVGAVIAAQGRG